MWTSNAELVEWRLDTLRLHLQGENIRHITYSVGDDDYLMNETRRKPTTRTRCSTLFDKWHGIFYMPITQSWTIRVGGIKVVSFPVRGGLEPATYRSTVKHTNHQTTRSPSNAKWTLHNNCYLQPLLAVGSQFCFPRWSCRPDAAPSVCVWVICEVMVTVTFPRTVSDGWPWPWCHLWMTLPFVASESRLCPWYGLQAKVDQWLNNQRWYILFSGHTRYGFWPCNPVFDLVTERFPSPFPMRKLIHLSTNISGLIWIFGSAAGILNSDLQIELQVFKKIYLL